MASPLTSNGRQRLRLLFKRCTVVETRSGRVPVGSIRTCLVRHYDQISSRLPGVLDHCRQIVAHYFHSADSGAIRPDRLDTLSEMRLNACARETANDRIAERTKHGIDAMELFRFSPEPGNAKQKRAVFECLDVVPKALVEREHAPSWEVERSSGRSDLNVTADRLD